MPLRLDEKDVATLKARGMNDQDACHYLLKYGDMPADSKPQQPKTAHKQEPQTKKKRRNSEALLIIVLVAMAFMWKFITFILIALAIALGFVVLLYFRSPKFKARVKNKFANIKAKIKI